MGRPVIPDEDLIKAMRSTGGAMAAVAQIFGISPRTLQRRLDKMRPFSLQPELTAEERQNIQIKYTILKKALAGDGRCCIFWLKNIGWGREIVEPKLINRSDHR